MTEALQDGVVVANFGKQVEILDSDGQILMGELASQLSTKPIAGDRVQFKVQNGQAYLVAIEARERVIRRAGRREGDEKLLASHVDLMVIVAAVTPELREGLIDRYMVAAGHDGMESLVVLNKVDLDDGTAARRIQLYADLGITTRNVSAVSGTNIEALRSCLKDKTSVLVGQSGVGKSSLLMALLPELDIRVSAVSDYSGKGVHTTTTARMHVSEGNMRIIDSPGIRAFGMSGIEPIEVREQFVEFYPHADNCKFRNCMHLQDSGCAVKEAVEREEISKIRYASYGRIVASLQEK
jgi:ribosome biogenesis GTPase